MILRLTSAQGVHQGTEEGYHGKNTRNVMRDPASLPDRQRPKWSQPFVTLSANLSDAGCLGSIPSMARPSGSL